jgi:hypothetical protein
LVNIPNEFIETVFNVKLGERARVRFELPVTHKKKKMNVSGTELEVVGPIRNQVMIGGRRADVKSLREKK